MSQQHKLQTQRFEIKYLVEERLALGIRDCVRSYLELDEFGATYPDLSYPVHSLYLDSPDLKLYHSTINSDRNRFKLRLRFYNDDPASPVFPEIKRRTNNIISKERSAVRAAAVPRLLEGHMPAPDDLISPSPKKLAALEHFCRLANDVGARPRTHVAYRREAWISPNDNSVRVTMDRHVLTEIAPSVHFTTRMKNPVSVFGGLIVLELKFTGRYPEWFQHLVRIFNLRQCGAAKYADGITRMGAHAVSNAYAFADHYAAAQSRLERIDRNEPQSPAAEFETRTSTPA